MAFFPGFGGVKKGVKNYFGGVNKLINDGIDGAGLNPHVWVTNKTVEPILFIFHAAKHGIIDMMADTIAKVGIKTLTAEISLAQSGINILNTLKKYNKKLGKNDLKKKQLHQIHGCYYLAPYQDKKLADGTIWNINVSEIFGKHDKSLTFFIGKQKTTITFNDVDPKYHDFQVHPNRVIRGKAKIDMEKK
eukprot:UN00867